MSAPAFDDLGLGDNVLFGDVPGEQSHIPTVEEVFGTAAPSEDVLGRFLAELYRDVERGQLLFNHDDDGFKSSWHERDVEDLSAAARRQNGNVWVPIGSRRTQLGTRRGGVADVLDVFAFVVDIDHFCDHHQTEKLPPDLDSALALLDDFPLEPTVTVATGGGIQGWWFAAEPWDVAEAIPVLDRWRANWRELGRRRGWHVDSTASADHVFRLPGTVNHASGSTVTILKVDYGRRFGLDDLDDVLVEEQIPEHPKPPKRPRLDGDDELAGDRYNREHTCDDLLTGDGCVYSHATRSTGDRHYYAPHRAASQDRIGATVYADGHAAIWSQTYMAKLGLTGDNWSGDAFGLYTHISHGGDFKAAAKAIYGADDVGLIVHPSRRQPRADVNPETGEIAARPLVLPDEFWQAHERLEHIRQAAHSRGRAPAAVLGCVLARVCAELDHSYVLPPIVGGIGSLNCGAVLVAPPGLGKSSSDGVADELLAFNHFTGDPRPRGIPLGSGEGVAEAYMGSRAATDDEKEAGLAVQGKIREQARWRELFLGDEGQAIMAQGKRNSATLLPALRSLLTGGDLGQQNAGVDNRRLIRKHNYRAAVLLGFQTSTAVELLDDAAGGTPQRFTFFAATDPTIPAPGQRPPWPGQLAIEQPDVMSRDDLPKMAGGRLAIPVCATARHEVENDDHARQTDAVAVDPLDAHRNLVRLRVAAILKVIIDGQPAVTDETWRLAGMIADHSRAVMGGIVAYKATATAESERVNHRRAANRELTIRDTVADRATKAMARAIGRKVRRVWDAQRVTTKRRDAQSACKGSDRRDGSFDEAVDLAIDNGWIVGDGDGFRPGESSPA